MHALAHVAVLLGATRAGVRIGLIGRVYITSVSCCVRKREGLGRDALQARGTALIFRHAVHAGRAVCAACTDAPGAAKRGGGFPSTQRVTQAGELVVAELLV